MAAPETALEVAPQAILLLGPRLHWDDAEGVSYFVAIKA